MEISVLNRLSSRAPGGSSTSDKDGASIEVSTLGGEGRDDQANKLILNVEEKGDDGDDELVSEIRDAVKNVGKSTSAGKAKHKPNAGKSRKRKASRDESDEEEEDDSECE